LTAATRRETIVETAFRFASAIVLIAAAFFATAVALATTAFLGGGLGCAFR